MALRKATKKSVFDPEAWSSKALTKRQIDLLAGQTASKLLTKENDHLWLGGDSVDPAKLMGETGLE